MRTSFVPINVCLVIFHLVEYVKEHQHWCQGTHGQNKMLTTLRKDLYVFLIGDGLRFIDHRTEHTVHSTITAIKDNTHHTVPGSMCITPG